MDRNAFFEFYRQHQGKIWGGMVGLVLALFILRYGFFQTLLIGIFVIGGIFLGARKENREKIVQFIQGIFDQGKNQ